MFHCNGRGMHPQHECLRDNIPPLENPLSMSRNI
jgi:hypothetical protein